MDEKTIWTTISEIAAKYALKTIAALIVFVLAEMLIRYITRQIGEGKWLKRLDSRNRQYLRAALRIGLNVLLIIILVAILGIPVASIITLMATIGGALALALQGSLANVASGIVLLVTHPFRIGDWINANDKTGQVVDQDLFYTTIRTIENLDIAIPNSQLANTVITNMSTQGTRRSNFTISAAYGTDPEHVRSVVLTYLKNHPLVIQDPEPFCVMSAMSQSSIDFTIRYWATKADYWNAWFDIQEGLYNTLRENGITIPFQQLDVHVVEGKKK